MALNFTILNLDKNSICFMKWARLYQKIFTEKKITADTLELNFIDSHHLMVAQIEDEIIGFLFYMVIVGECQILDLGVDFTARRQGVGKALILALQKIGANNQFSFIDLEVASSNLSAMLLYEKCGFVKNGERKAYYPNGDHAILMRGAVL